MKLIEFGKHLSSRIATNMYLSVIYIVLLARAERDCYIYSYNI